MPRRDAFKHGIRVSRVNRHMRKRAWLERDGAVAGVDAFFKWVEDILFPPMKQLDHALGAFLNRRGAAMDLFQFKGRWYPSTFIPYATRRRYGR